MHTNLNFILNKVLEHLVDTLSLTASVLDPAVRVRAHLFLLDANGGIDLHSLNKYVDQGFMITVCDRDIDETYTDTLNGMANASLSTAQCEA